MFDNIFSIPLFITSKERWMTILIGNQMYQRSLMSVSSELVYHVNTCSKLYACQQA